ncbi:hypothetical protein COO60DRAFT_406130 [Scenedesmus sp. NREL 46B-D3]|nr:hypothetical protein COO60DRAFT_406130 [Scenedesmus sp. NREL 46B-D3]
MPPKGKSAAWSRQKVQQAVKTLSAAASDLTQQTGKISELVDHLKRGIPTPGAIGDVLRQTSVLSVMLSVVTARMQQQDLLKQELPLFWEVCIGLTQCVGGWQAFTMMQPGYFGSQPSLERQVVTAGLLPALAKTAVSLTVALKQQQQQQQQQGLPELFTQYDVHDCLQLSSAVLHSWILVPTMLQQRGVAIIQPSLLPITALGKATFVHVRLQRPAMPAAAAAAAAAAALAGLAAACLTAWVCTKLQ